MTHIQDSGAAGLAHEKVKLNIWVQAEEISPGEFVAAAYAVLADEASGEPYESAKLAMRSLPGAREAAQLMAQDMAARLTQRGHSVVDISPL